MSYVFADYQRAAEEIAERIGLFRPEIAMILGSGLGDMAELIREPITIPYCQVSGFRVSTAPGHKGALVFGMLEGRRVAVMQGRLHCYEGYSMEEVCFPLRVLRLLGAETLVITNAAGGVNAGFRVGDICLITDQIKLVQESPLRGEHIPELGSRFPDSSRLYTPRLQTIAREAAQKQGMTLREGVYMYFPGPSYETPAEIRAARLLGADLVGMSTVPEVLAAGHAAMEVLGLSLVANAAAGMVEGATLTEQEVLDAAQAAKPVFSRLVQDCIAML